MHTILCVDDDELVQATVSEYLKNEGFTVFSAYDRASALDIIKNDKPHLILMDLILDKTSGLDFLKDITTDFPFLPIIMISNRGEEIDRIIGLEAGADDYIAKPFHPRELSARIKALLKRSQRSFQPNPVIDSSVHFDHWVLDSQNYQVYDEKNGQPAKLTTKEFMVLKELIMNRNRVLSRDYIFHIFRDYSEDIYDRVVDIQISRIRSKLGDDSKNPKYIRTIRDVGYTFIADVKKQTFHGNEKR